ncbi:MAG: hypothetical protein CRU72_01770 [Candidatus Accumulibacter phosphatis]|jgi:uncharacterized membrane protein|nr:hypothetical protein [Candidatus Accumulibacter phosphatis]
MQEESMSLVAAQTPAAQTWEARRDCSLSVVERKWLFRVTATWSGAIAIAFSYFGAWPVLPFTGLELCLLWWALRQIDASADDFERITLEAERLTIETRCGARWQRHAFHPYWAQLQFDRTPGRQRRLLIRSHGKEVEVGRWLTEEQKWVLGNELKKNLGAARPEKTL